MKPFKKAGASVKNFVKRYPVQIATTTTIAIGMGVLWVAKANRDSRARMNSESIDFDQLETELAALDQA